MPVKFSVFALAAACPELPFLVMESWHIAPQWRAHCIERAARLGNIEWCGPTQDMREVFARSRVLLMPSVWEESFGRTVIEAQLNGLPVLASNRGALPDLVGDGGLALAPEAAIGDGAQARRPLYAPVLSARHREAAQRQAAAHVVSTPLIVGELLSLLAVHASQSLIDGSDGTGHALDRRIPPATPDPLPASMREVAPPSPRLEDCRFYHSSDLADGTEVTGEWDLRRDPFGYLGDVCFTGQSVLEVGPASGFLSFCMEAAGASVTCVEPPMSHLWDVVPLEGFDTSGWRDMFSEQIEKVRNSFWYMHRQHGSRIRVFEGDPYELPPGFGPFDVGVLASVLLHCRRPFDLLQSVAERVRHTMVVTELYDPALGDAPACWLLPNTATPQVHTWWLFTPQFFVSALGVLGFTECTVSVHTQKQPAENREVTMFTVVARRPPAR